MEFRFFNPGKIEDARIQEVSVAVRCGTMWLFQLNQDTHSWDLIHTRRVSHENLDETAKRITACLPGCIFIDGLLSVCPYSIETEGETVYGMLYFAAATASQDEIDHSFKLFSKIPDSLTRSEATRRLFTGTQGWLNMQTNADELWDVYDENRNLTGRLHRRGDFLEEGDYHLVVHVWLLNSKGEFLLTKRAPNKGFPNTWETSGGAAQAGDNSLSAALGEVREETGLTALPENTKLIYSFRREEDFCDVWLVRQDFDLKDVVLLEGETIDKTYVNSTELLRMYESKELIRYSYLKDFLSKI